MTAVGRLGIKLVTGKSQMEMIAVDHMAKPTEN